MTSKKARTAMHKDLMQAESPVAAQLILDRFAAEYKESGKDELADAIMNAKKQFGVWLANNTALKGEQMTTKEIVEEGFGLDSNGNKLPNQGFDEEEYRRNMYSGTEQKPKKKGVFRNFMKRIFKGE